MSGAVENMMTRRVVAFMERVENGMLVIYNEAVEAPATSTMIMNQMLRPPRNPTDESWKEDSSPAPIMPRIFRLEPRVIFCADDHAILVAFGKARQADDREALLRREGAVFESVMGPRLVSAYGPGHGSHGM